MHPLRASFVLLATTFVTAVVATPMNVQIRRDNPLDIITDAFNETNQAVKILNSDIDQLSSGTDGLVKKVLVEFSTAVLDVDGLFNLMASLNPSFGEDGSQRLLDSSVLPLFGSFNETIIGIAQQANVIEASFSPFENNTLMALLEEMLVDMSTVGLAAIVRTCIASDAAAQLDSVASSVSDNLRNVTASIFGLGAIEG